MLEFQNVAFSYPEAKPLFKELSFFFRKGAFYLIVGPSGAGKSTLLKLMNRIEIPSCGEIRFQGEPFSGFYPPLLRSRIIYIQQTPAVESGSIRDNLLLPYRFKANAGKKRPNDDLLSSYMNDFMLEGVALNDSAETLSVGQMQRICLIRGMLLDPLVLLLDEPTSALDPESRRIVEEKAQAFVQTGEKMVVMVSHHAFSPDKVTPVVLEVKRGDLREIGT
jgi:putative ABC transport system ATP-binding protein